MSGISDLLADLGIEAVPGVAGGGLESFEAETGLRLPESVRALYTACDGAVLDAGLRILSLESVLEEARGFRNFGFPSVGATSRSQTITTPAPSVPAARRRSRATSCKYSTTTVLR